MAVGSTILWQLKTGLMWTHKQAGRDDHPIYSTDYQWKQHRRGTSNPTLTTALAHSVSADNLWIDTHQNSQWLRHLLKMDKESEITNGHSTNRTSTQDAHYTQTTESNISSKYKKKEAGRGMVWADNSRDPRTQYHTMSFCLLFKRTGQHVDIPKKMVKHHVNINCISKNTTQKNHWLCSVTEALQTPDHTVTITRAPWR